MKNSFLFSLLEGHTELTITKATSGSKLHKADIRALKEVVIQGLNSVMEFLED